MLLLLVCVLARSAQLGDDGDDDSWQMRSLKTHVARVIFSKAKYLR